MIATKGRPVPWRADLPTFVGRETFCKAFCTAKVKKTKHIQKSDTLLGTLAQLTDNTNI